MARPPKKGISYFSVDTDMLSDRKIRRVTHRHGAESIAVILKLWSLGYDENGYYLILDGNLVFDVADFLNLSEKLVGDVIFTCIEAEVFDKRMYEEYEILTSKRMQLNYKQATVKRKDAEIDDKYLLLMTEETELLPEETELLPEIEEEILQNRGEMQQIKRNKKKLNKNKDDVINREQEQQDTQAREDDLWPDERDVLLDLFGAISEYTRDEFIKLEKKYGWEHVLPALEKTKLMKGQTIDYTRTLLEEKYAARV